MKLAVDLCTGPSQSLTVGRGKGGHQRVIPDLTNAFSNSLPHCLMRSTRLEGHPSNQEIWNPQRETITLKYTVGTKGNGEG